MRLASLTLLLLLLFTGCTSERDARRALEAEGYKEIVLTGYSVFGCAKEDWFRTGFQAVNRDGKAVSGTVCSGWLKSATIRY